MTGNTWSAVPLIWGRLKPPGRPNAEVAAAVCGAVQDHRARVLLLGVTPELSTIAASTVALDMNDAMIAHVWPGDTPARRVIRGNWLAMPLERQFSAVIGDGSLNVLVWKDYPRLFAELERVLMPGARLAMRVYTTPGPCETVAQLCAAAWAGRVGGFFAFKWRLLMAILGEQGGRDIPVALGHRVFEREFPDRAALGRAAGWSVEDIGEIDIYAGSNTIFSFPRRSEVLGALAPSFADPRFIEAGSYELAERCPILVADYRP